MQIESVITFEILGLTVTSEVLWDRETAHPDGGHQRSIMLQNSCDSRRWGRRSANHSYSCPANWSGFEQSFAQARFQSAEALAKQERGIIPDQLMCGGMGISVIGPAGKEFNGLATVDLSTPPTRLWPEAVEALGLKPSGQTHWEQNPVDKNWRRVLLYRGTVKFDQYEVETNILPTHMTTPCVLGGEFFQKALAEKPFLIYDLLGREYYRTLAGVARCKKTYVLIIGKYGQHRARLERIREVLEGFQLAGLIVDDLPDIEEQSIGEKMVTFASIARFVICDDLVASGHINELEICSERRFTTAVLRLRGRAATAMQTDIADRVAFMKIIEYGSDETLEEAVRQAVNWAQGAVMGHAYDLNRKYQWRAHQTVMR